MSHSGDFPGTRVTPSCDPSFAGVLPRGGHLPCLLATAHGGNKDPSLTKPVSLILGQLSPDLAKIPAKPVSQESPTFHGQSGSLPPGNVPLIHSPCLLATSVHLSLSDVESSPLSPLLR